MKEINEKLFNNSINVLNNEDAFYAKGMTYLRISKIDIASQIFKNLIM